MPWSFYELPYTLPYFYLLPRVSKTSRTFHKTDPKPNPNLELPPWKLAYLQRPWKLVKASKVDEVIE